MVVDSDETRLADVADRIAEELARESSADQVGRLVRTSANLSDLAPCGLVLESIVERLAAKQELLAQLQGVVGGHAVLASNSSTIPVARLAERLDDPGRFCGFHFFHPVAERPLVEIIRGSATKRQTIDTAAAHAQAIGKTPIVVSDGPGFLVNRLLLPYLGEALDLLLEGATMEAVERAAVDFGMAKGPLRLIDEIGLDTVLQGGWVLAAAFPERVVASPLLVGLVKAGRTGCKSGAGFFSYPPGPSRSDPDQTVQGLIAQWSRPIRSHTAQSHTTQSITRRLMLPMVLEATRVMEEKKVGDPRDIDLAAVLGLGFPASRGGPLRWADTLGAARIVEMLQPMKRLGGRAQVTDLLGELARTGGRFTTSE